MYKVRLAKSIVHTYSAFALTWNVYFDKKRFDSSNEHKNYLSINCYILSGIVSMTSAYIL